MDGGVYWTNGVLLTSARSGVQLALHPNEFGNPELAEPVSEEAGDRDMRVVKIAGYRSFYVKADGDRAGFRHSRGRREKCELGTDKDPTTHEY